MEKASARERIAGACMALLETTSLESMKTQDLMEKAGISRSTFYRLFADKFEVANWIYQRETEKIIRDYPDLKNWNEWSLVLHNYMRAHKKFFRNIAGYTGQNSFRDFLCRYFAGNVLKYRTGGDSEVTEEQRFAVQAFSLVGAQTTVDWIQNGFQPDAETLLGWLNACIPPCIRSFYQ